MKKIISNNTGIYLRGTFNDWKTSNEFSKCSDGSLVARNVKFTKGINSFKIADSAWTSDCNYGYNGNDPGMFCFTYTLSNNTGANMSLVARKDTVADVYIYRMNDNSLQIRLRPQKNQ